MKRVCALFLAAVLLTGCSFAENTQDPAALFALSLFRVSINEEKNLVISPFSVYLAMGMAAAGASGNTLTELEKLLNIPSDQLAAYCSELAARISETTGSTSIRIADSVWVDNSAEILSGYARIVSEAFKADILNADLASDDARTAINAWVSEKTSGLIPEFLMENLPPEAVFALINTLFFKAKWKDPFYAADTGNRDFRLENGDMVSTEFLCDTDCFRSLIRTGDAEGILLPYDDDTTAFIALRPAGGLSIEEFAQQLTAEKIAEYMDIAVVTYMDFSMPKFTAEYFIEMSDILRKKGLEEAFDPIRADFTNLGVTDGNICISKVLHKVKVEVNEEGTEAAAASAVIMAKSSFTFERPEILSLDSPYVYAVVEIGSGIPLFIGMMNDPSAL